MFLGGIIMSASTQHPIAKSSDNNSSYAEFSKLIHEIKNPLCIIKGALQIIELQIPAVKENKYWDGVFSDINFINSLLNDFSLYNKISMISLKPLNLTNILQCMCVEIEPLMVSNNVTFTCDLTDRPIICNIDCTRLKEAFVNLVKNSLESLPNENGYIKISLQTYNNFANIIIEDNGCGISEDKMSTIFNPFITYKKNGTGLGLPIAQSILTNHYGAINLISTENIGTTLTMSIPLVN
jgi:two-component system sensor histidine kinase AtoS